MTPYALALLSLTLALVAQCLAAGYATAAALRRPYRRTAMVLAIGLTLLAFNHGYSLELALHTGLFDLRQALLAAGVSLFLLFGLSALRHPKSETPPPQ